MSGVRVLVVEDCRDTADCLGTLLRILGCEVGVAYSGVEALTKAKAFCPHVAFIDVAMPGITGLTVAEKMRADGTAKDTLLVAMSGYVDAKTQELARMAGFDRFLPKPSDIHDVLGIISPLRKALGYDATIVSWPVDADQSSLDSRVGLMGRALGQSAG